MPGNFAYAPATNIVEVTAGTALNPADFASFVIADRAGTYTVMDAIATALNLTLDRLIRPVELRALKITFNLAGTNAGAGDTVDITGTDAWDNAQVESINVAAGNGAYISAKYWRTITDVDCTGFADGVGTINAVQGQWGVIWDYGNGHYEIDSYFHIGGGDVSTYFQSKDESAVINSDCRTFANAVTTIGEASNDYSKNGSLWIFNEDVSGQNYLSSGGTMYVYGSILRITGDTKQYFNSGTVVIKDSILEGRGPDVLAYFKFEASLTSLTLNNVYFSNLLALYLLKTGTLDDVHVEGTTDGLKVDATPLIATNLNITNSITRELYHYWVNAGDTRLIDPKFHIATLRLGDGDTCKEQYTCNIHIADKDGANLAGVTVDCEDQFGTPVWAAGTITTDAAGDIAEQIITYKRWLGTSETLTTYSPHIFTISKAGYETLVLDAITVDAPIVWHEELLPALVEGDVRDGVAYGEDETGTLDLPAIGDVEKGVQFDSLTKTGTFKPPPVADVRDGEGYGAGDVEFEGELDLPAEADVEDGVTYDGATKEGNFEAPAEDDVEDGVGYGSNGAEFEGDLEIPAIGDVRDGIGFGADGIELEGILDLPSINDVEDGVKYDNDTKEGNFEAPAEEDVEVGVGYGSLGAEFEGTYLGLKGENLTAELEESVNLVGYLEDKIALSGEISNE